MHPPSGVQVDATHEAAHVPGSDASGREPSGGGSEDEEFNLALPIIQAPEEIMERFKMLCPARTKCSPLDPPLLDITTAFSGLSVCVRKGNSEHLATLAYLWENGLGDLCEELVNEQDFFLDHPDWILAVADIVDGNVSRCAKYRGALTPTDYAASPPLKQLQRIIVSLCRAGCCHRELFKNDNARLQAYSPGAAGDLRFRMQHLLNMSLPTYGAAAGDGGFSMGSEEATAHYRRMATIVWWYSTPDEYWPADALITATLQILSSSSVEDCSDFLENEVMKLIGPFNFLTRLCGYLRREDFPDHFYQERLLQGLEQMIALRPFWPHYSSSGFFESLRYMLDSCVSLEDDQHWALMEAALRALTNITEEAPTNDAASPLIQAGTAEDGDPTCVEMIQLYTRIAVALGLRTGKNTLRKSLRQATRREWYRVLKWLRQQPLRDRGTSRKCTDLIPAWQGLGRALDLDEASEKADFEREMKKAAQMCAWVECDYHVEKPPHPTRACVGCAETRYCSRLCQQRDWREGNHKLRCKRLKNDPHKPR
ncbi:unnamed protein product [Peniophora sp. CBMAI 1063]|nr:unnamed protein product [Peniophora sp. CBMAI 1063]